ncbi:MAG TPA: MbtH family NRPS accessory protein [Chthoniobacter sp.]
MASSLEPDSDMTFEVVVNDEGQYSLWPSWQESVPPGWKKTGFSGSKEACAAHIDTVWLDMTPISLRGKTQPGVSPQE